MFAIRAAIFVEAHISHAYLGSAARLSVNNKQLSVIISGVFEWISYGDAETCDSSE